VLKRERNNGRERRISSKGKAVASKEGVSQMGKETGIAHQQRAKKIEYLKPLGGKPKQATSKE